MERPTDIEMDKLSGGADDDMGYDNSGYRDDRSLSPIFLEDVINSISFGRDYDYKPYTMENLEMIGGDYDYKPDEFDIPG